MNSHWRALTFFDKVLETASFSGLILMVFISAFYFNQLPEKIPIHFDLSGQPNDSGARISIFLLPSIGVLFYLLMFFLVRHVRGLNFPVPLTLQNREKMLSLTGQLFRFIRAAVVLFLLLIHTSVVQVALGRSYGINMTLIPIFLLVFIAILTIYIYRMIQLHRE
jgi:hypothetical protein